MIKVCGTRCVRHHSSLLHFTLGLFGPCHNKSHNGQAGIAGYSCQGYRCPAGLTSLLIPAGSPSPWPLPARGAGGPGNFSRWFSVLCWRCRLHHLLSVVLLSPLPKEKKRKKKNPQNKPHQIGRKEGHKMVHVRCQNKDF